MLYDIFIEVISYSFKSPLHQIFQYGINQSIMKYLSRLNGQFIRLESNDEQFIYHPQA